VMTINYFLNEGRRRSCIALVPLPT